MQTIRELWGMPRDGDPMNLCGDLNDKVPVYNVSWDDAVRFCRRLTDRARAAGTLPEGYEFRLPTEAQWEYACRAGTKTSLPNGRDIRIVGENNAPALDDIAWYGGNSSVDFEGSGWDTDGWKEKQYPGGRAFAREVRGKAANEWGLYDMIGNVWEWCSDGYVIQVGSVCVSRGGSWFNDARNCRPARRSGDGPGSRGPILGLRVALLPAALEDLEGLSEASDLDKAKLASADVSSAAEWIAGNAEARERLDAVEKEIDGLKPGERGGDALPVTVGGVRFNLRWCPAGSFDMGSPNGDGENDEHPRHRVTLTRGFWLGETEVTQELWKEVMGENPSNNQGGGNYPVERVSWNDCQEFLRRLNARTDVAPAGLRFALPTEAQWEYACRAGTTGDYGGTGSLDGMGWYASNSGNRTHPVGEKGPNAWKLRDMHGNVYEWCADWYDGCYYAKSPATDPPGPASGGSRVLRGGGCWGNPEGCRSVSRLGYSPGIRGRILGLRLLAFLDD